jgi:hypothetical protein
MKKKYFISTFLVLLLAALGCGEVSNAPSEKGRRLAEGFQNPPIDARPRGLWTWVNGNYDSTEIRREIRMAKETGMGGFDIWDAPTVQDRSNVVPIGPDQISDEFQRGVGIAVNAARENGYELGYIWNQSVSFIDPEHSHMAMYLTSVSANKPGEQTFTLPFPEIEPNKKWGYKTLQRDENGRPKYWGNVAILAYPVRESDEKMIRLNEIIDLTGQTDGDILTWDVPEGSWKILRFVWSRTTANGLTPTPASLKPALDFLNPEATEIHLTYLLDLMEKHTSPLKDSPLKYLCADSYEFKRLWTPTLPQTFKDSLGYDIIKYLPALEGYTVDDQETTDRFLFDFNNLRSELVIANHYAKAKEVCNRYGIGFTSEAAGPGPPVHLDVPMESIKSSGALSWPRGEFWVSEDKKKREDLQIIKGIASAANQYNQPYVTAEAFTGVPLWAHGPGDLKQFSDRAFAEGLNRIDFHTFPHTPAEAGKPGWIYGFATIISENLIWWPKAAGFMHYLGRSSFMLQQGHFIGDALYYHGEEAPFFAKPKHFKPELGLGYDYDITNADILLNRLSVENGKLMLPHGQHYEVLVLPDKNFMTMPVLKKIEQLLNDGAVIIGPKPVKSNGLIGNPNERDEAVNNLADKIWGDLDGKQATERKVGEGKLVWGKTPRQVLMEKGIIPDITFTTASITDTLDYIHRRADEVDFYFIRNPYEKEIAVQVAVRVTGKQPETWNPVTGEMKPLSLYQSKKSGTTVPLTFEPYGSVFLVFRNNGEQQATVKKEGVTVFPAEKMPQQWPFSDEGEGNIRLLEAGSYAISGDGKFKVEAETPETFAVNNSTWKIDFTDPWDEQFSAETDELKSWPEFDEHRIKYFSGLGVYHNSFDLPADAVEGKHIVLNLGQIEEAAEVFVNGESAGLVWNNPARIEISGWVKPGTNKLTVEVANRWPNRMIGDYKLPKAERKVKSNIISLPTGWHAPLEDLPNEQFGLQESGLLGPVQIEVYDVLKMYAM